MAIRVKKKKIDLDAALARAAAIKKKWNITDEEEAPPQVKPKKKEKSWIRSALDSFRKRFKGKKTEEGITRPAGVRTPEQIAEWRELMGIGKKKKK